MTVLTGKNINGQHPLRIENHQRLARQQRGAG
jgi:hypothetical protein